MNAIVNSPNMVPDYEVRLLLNPTVVLSPEHALKGTVLSTFDMASTMTISVQFLDTSSKEIYNASWSARIRKAEDKDDLELTYKKRYTITDGNMDAALTVANNDGLDGSDAK